eukprot:3531612-Pyramimonas_sp.AAC.1
MLGKGCSWVTMLLLDTATCAKHPGGDLCHLHRVKGIIIPDGKFTFPVKEGTLRHHNPESHDEVKAITSRPLGDEPMPDPPLAYPTEWDDPSMITLDD